MASGDRFYQLEFKNRPVFWGDIGSLLKIDGLLVSGGGVTAALHLPTSSSMNHILHHTVQMSEEEWSEYLRLSDDPQILIMPGKAFHRKLRYEISGHVQQKIWVADKLACVYCGREMGDVQLTIDHFIPLELGGKNDISNYLSACRKCNKDKGSQHPKDFCSPQKYLELEIYLAERVIK